MKITLNDVTNIDALTVINDNFDRIEQELQNKVLYRDNPSGEPNSMSNDIDMNGNDILNAGDVFSINGRWATINELEEIQSQVETDAAEVVSNKNLTIGYRDTAQLAATNAQSVYDDFDDRYLGSKTSDPSVDNDGNTLLTGALYYRTSGTPIMRVYNGTTWQDVGSITTSVTNLVDPSLYASQVEAEAGVNNTKVMTPLRTKESIVANAITKRWLTGEWVFYPKSTAPAGCVVPNGGTIGSSTSGATNRANEDTRDLFIFLWEETNNTDFPIQDSSGAATTRGASGNDDFDANKRHPLPLLEEGDSFVITTGTFPVFTKTSGEVKSHNHNATVTDPGHSHWFYDLRNGGGGGYNGAGSVDWSRSTFPSTTGVSVSISNTGGAKNKASGMYTRVYLAL